MAKASLHILPDSTKLAVDLQIKSGGVWRFDCVEIKKEKGELVLKEQFENLSKESFLNKTHAIHPVYLFINGKGILSKKIKDEANENRVLEFLLPGAKRRDFFLEKFEDDQSSIYSIIRNDLLSEIVEFFESNNYRLINFSINPGILSAFAKIDDKLEQVSNAFYQLDFKNGVIQDLSSTVNQGLVPFGSQSLSTANSSSLAIHLQEQFGNFVNRENEFVSNAVKEEKFKTWMQYGIAASVAFLLVLMTANYFAFDHYSSKQDELNNSYANKKSEILEIDRLKESISKKKALVNYAGIDQYHNYAFYADQIANTIPKQINLTQMFLSPMEGGLKDKKKAEHKRELIWLKGNINQEEYFDSWIEELKELNCCKKVKINQFSYDSKKRTNEFYLVIEV